MDNDEKLRPKRAETLETDFVIFGREGSGLRMLAGALGRHPEVIIDTAGLDGIENRRLYGYGDILGKIIKYENSEMLFQNIPPRVIHLVRDPEENAAEILLRKSSQAPNKKQISLLGKKILREQRNFRSRLISNENLEVFELPYVDLISMTDRKSELITDFLFLKCYRLKIKRMLDE